MSNPVPLSPGQMESLIQSLAQQLHCDPNQLRQQLQSGNFSAVTRSMSNSDVQQVKKLMNDPKQLQQVMNSPEMKELLRRIQKK